jgi:hypothetical protein
MRGHDAQQAGGAAVVTESTHSVAADARLTATAIVMPLRHVTTCLLFFMALSPCVCDV